MKQCLEEICAPRAGCAFIRVSTVIPDVGSIEGAIAKARLLNSNQILA